MDYLAGICEFTGSWLLGNKSRFGFLLNIGAGLTWGYVAIHNQVYGLLFVSIPAVIINIRNYRRWLKERDIEKVMEYERPDDFLIG